MIQPEIDVKEALNVKEFLKNKLQTNNKLRNIYEKKDFMFFAKMKNFNIARNELIDNIKKHNTWIKSYSIPKIYRVDRSGIPEKNIYGQYCEMSIYSERSLDNLPKEIIIESCSKEKKFPIEILQWGNLPEKNVPLEKISQKSVLPCIHFKKNKCTAKYKDEQGKCIYIHTCENETYYESNPNSTKLNGLNTSSENNTMNKSNTGSTTMGESNTCDGYTTMSGLNTNDENKINLMAEIKLNNTISQENSVIKSSNSDESKPKNIIEIAEKNLDSLSPMSTENEQIFIMNNTFYNAADNMEQAANKNTEDNTVEDTDGQWITPEKKNKKKKKNSQSSEKPTDKNKKKKQIVNQARNLPDIPRFTNPTGVTLERSATPKRKTISPLAPKAKSAMPIRDGKIGNQG